MKKAQDPDSIASRIKAARREAGLTQPEAAHRTGVPLSSYQGYEQGKTMPPADRVEQILTALRAGEENHAEQNDLPESNGKSVPQAEAGGADAPRQRVTTPAIVVMIQRSDGEWVEWQRLRVSYEVEVVNPVEIGTRVAAAD